MISPELGYDPRPDVRRWRGTPIPPVANPLPITPRRAATAGRVWWNGPPWTILRNSSAFLWRVMDHGADADIRDARRELDDELWLDALDAARPSGDLSRGSWLLWSLVCRRWSPGRHEAAARVDWPAAAHRLDWKPLAGASRDHLYRRQALAHYLARGLSDRDARDRVAAHAAADWRHRTPF